MQPLVLTLCVMLSAVAPVQQKDSRTLRIEADVQRELFQLPYYTIFDFLAFRVEPAGTLTDGALKLLNTPAWPFGSMGAPPPS